MSVRIKEDFMIVRHKNELSTCANHGITTALRQAVKAIALPAAYPGFDGYVDERRNRKAYIEQLHLDKLSSVLLG